MFDASKILNNASKTIGDLYQAVRDKKNISVFGLSFYDRVFISSALGQRLLYVCPNAVAAANAFAELKCLRPNVIMLPAKDDVLTLRLNQYGDSAVIRMEALGKLLTCRDIVAVTTAQAAGQLFPPPDKFREGILLLKKGQSCDVYDIVKKLESIGYKREERIESRGHYSLRGDILDVFPVSLDNGVRIEFFGDEIESVRSIDVEKQNSVSQMQEVTVYPYTEVFYRAEDVPGILQEIKKELPALSGENKHRQESIYAELQLRLENLDRSYSMNYILPYLGGVALKDFCSFSAVVYDESKEISDGVTTVLSEHMTRYAALLEKGETLKRSYLQASEDILAEGVKICYHKITTQNRLFTPQAVLSARSFPMPDYFKNYGQLIDDVKMWLREGYDVHIAAGESCDFVREILKDADIYESASDSKEKGRLLIEKDYLYKGAVLFDDKTIVIGTNNLVSRKEKITVKRSKREVFNEPQVGDYVVHNIHGIGFCEKIEKIEAMNCRRDYLIIRYQNNDTLYVPVENMDSLSKYSAGDKAPKLSKLGGADFAKIKEKVKASVKAMAIDLLNLYSDRKNLTGYKYSADDSLMEEFVSDFPYSETEDQLTSTQEAINDLIDGKIMDRLLCGDVGYGKTEVALRVAFKVILEGKQVAFVAPTTILAYQHFKTVQARMEKFGIRIASLTRFNTAEEIKKSLASIAEGKTDIVCGTHRVLSKDVHFKDLGLLILDEEQRFGVADKEKIKDMKRNVNVLTLSATPIPRTLYMSMSGIRDISILDTPPKNRIPIQTYVTEFTQGIAVDAITREVNRGGQVFVVYNKVADIDSFAFKLSQALPDLRVKVAHGQMPKHLLEEVIDGFVAGQGDVLVASTIIENGIDMPHANTMIVCDADKLGLAQLYQLRGRVGRSDKLAYVYFTYDGAKILTEDAYKRLEAITEYTEFGSGFKIAMRDLEIRGAGNVLGREQHGHLEKVGYDMYTKLLGDAVKELKGEKTAETGADVKVIIDYNAYIPEDYVTDKEWRVKLYSRISKINSVATREQVKKDLLDSYNTLPDCVANLLTVAMVKNLAATVKAVKVVLKKGESAVCFEKIKDIGDHVMAVSSGKGTLKVGKSPELTFKSNADLINFLLKCKEQA